MFVISNITDFTKVFLHAFLSYTARLCPCLSVICCNHFSPCLIHHTICGRDLPYSEDVGEKKPFHSKSETNLCKQSNSLLSVLHSPLFVTKFLRALCLPLCEFANSCSVRSLMLSLLLFPCPPTFTFPSLCLELIWVINLYPPQMIFLALCLRNYQMNQTQIM